MVAEQIAPYGRKSDNSKVRFSDRCSDGIPDSVSATVSDRSAEEPFADLFERLSRSKFRSSFFLKSADVAYVRNKGMDTIHSHACDFIRQRLAPAEPKNDGKQTPMRGHPVFITQHATGCCCRGCLEKWHKIPKGKELSEEQQKYVVDVLMAWIERQIKANEGSQNQT